MINESGVYALIFGSKLPSAKKFKRWVTSEVLPSIRKTGTYSTKPQLPQTYAEALEELLEQVKEKERKEKENQLLLKQNVEQQKIIEAQAPKINYLDKILQSKSTMTVSQIAKDYGMSARTFNQKLKELKIQYNCNGQWLLYAQYQTQGYTHSKVINFNHQDGREDTKLLTEWTQKGRLFLYNLLKNNNVYPLIERETLNDNEMCWEW